MQNDDGHVQSACVGTLSLTGALSGCIFWWRAWRCRPMGDRQQQQQQTSWIALWFAQLKVCKCCSTHSAPHIQAYKRLWYFQRCLCPTSTTSWARAAHVMRFFRSWLSGAQRHSNCPRHVSMPASKHGDHQLLLPGADASISSSHDTFCSFLFFKLPVWDGSGGHSERIPGSQIEVSHFTASPAQQRIQFRIFAKMPGSAWLPHSAPRTQWNQRSFEL